MRETGVVRFRFSGDPVVVDSYRGRARTELGQLKLRMKDFGAQSLIHSRRYPDGVTVTVSSVYGQDTIQIDAAPVGGAAAAKVLGEAPLEEGTEAPVYSMVVGADENWVIDVSGAYAGGNRAYKNDRNVLDQPAAYSGGTRRVTARGGRYATLTDLTFVSDGNIENAVASVADTALFDACVPTIKKTYSAPAGVLGENIGDYYRYLFDDAHWPVLHKLFINFMGLVKVPSELHGQLNAYLPVRLYPLHYYLDAAGEVVVVFGMQQAVGQPTPVVSGVYAADVLVYTEYEVLEGTVNAIPVYNPLNTVLARCRARDLPLSLRAPQSSSSFGVAALPSSLGKDVTVVDAPFGSAVDVSVFGDVLALPIPDPLDLSAQYSFTSTIGSYLVTYELLGEADASARIFSGVVRLRAATPSGRLYVSAGGSPQSLHDIAGTSAFSQAEFPATLQYYATQPIKVPLDFLELIDVKGVVSSAKWFTPPVGVPQKIPRYPAGARSIGLAGTFTSGGYHESYQTGKEYSLDGASSPLGPFMMVLCSYYWESISRLEVPQYFFNRWVLSFVQKTFRFRPDGTIEELGTSAGVPGATYNTSYNVTTGFTAPFTYLGHHKGSTVPLGVGETSYGPGGISFALTYDSIVAVLTSVAKIESNRQVEGIPVAYPDAHIGVLYPHNYSLTSENSYTFYYKGVRIAGPDVPSYQSLGNSFGNGTNVALAYTTESIGTDGVGTISASDSTTVAAAVPAYPALLNPQNSGVQILMDVPEYPMSGGGTRTGGLVVTCYLRNARGAEAGVCVVQRSFSADIFASAYLTNPFDKTTLPELREILYWFLNTASQPSAPEPDEDPAARASFPNMVAAAQAALDYYDATYGGDTWDTAIFKNLIRDVAREGRRVLVNNFASTPLIDFITSHSQTLVLLPYTSQLLAT